MLLKFVGDTFSDICPGWVDECNSALLRLPVSCFIAEHDGQVIGFACYDTTAKGFLGPLGTAPDFRCQGIARALIVSAMHAMESEGYGYAIIPWVRFEEFYQKAVGAVSIPDSEPGVYRRLVGR